MTTTLQRATKQRTTERAANADPRYCRVPACVNDAVAVLAGAWLDPVPLCERHFVPVRRYLVSVLASAR